MGISIVNYTTPDSTDSNWGVLKNQKVYRLDGDYESHRALMQSYFSNQEDFLSRIESAPVSDQSIEFNSPITADVQLFCQGLNYADHRAESGASGSDKGEGLVFLKAPSSICGPNDDIVRPRGCELLDYEIELALVLKKDIPEPATITESDLPNYVGGMVLCNDVSARDLMFGAPMLQWFKGKSQRTFCPMGPVLYLMDQEDFQHLYNLQLTLKLNGDTKQSASTDLLIHRPAETLTEISSYANIASGDCLLTGTPGGVLGQASIKAGLALMLNLTNDQKRRKKFTQALQAKARFLQPGDRLDLSIRTPQGEIDLGEQRNEICDAVF